MTTLARIELNQTNILKRLSTLEKDSTIESVLGGPMSSFEEFIKFDESLGDKKIRRKLVSWFEYFNI